MVIKECFIKAKQRNWKKSLLPQHNLLEKKVKTQVDSVIKAPYIGGRSDCKNKTFTGSEFIKQRIESVADIICSWFKKKKKDFSKTS